MDIAVPLHTYRFLTHWSAKGTCAEAYDILEESLNYPKWWPAVWLHAERISPEDDKGLGGITKFITKGWLPYIIRWNSKSLVKDRPHRLEIQAMGDFVGHGCWTFRQEDGQVRADYLWELSAEKPLLRFLSPLMKPLFSWNHRWTMNKGELSFRLELQRRRAALSKKSVSISPPPGPVFFLGKPKWLPQLNYFH